MINPKTPEQWQEVVDLAAGMRAIADCMMYGLIEGLDVNVERCDEILWRGQQRGVKPSRPAADLAQEIIAAINAEKKTDA